MASSGAPPNQSLEQTHQTVIKFAYANLPPVWRAAQLSCSALCVNSLWQHVETKHTAPKLIENFTDAQLP
jgi:hypothetical protein